MADFTVYDSGDYGVALDVTLTNDGAQAQNISTALSVQFLAESPISRTTKTWSAGFATDGADGVARYTLAVGDLLVDGVPEPGTWVLRVRLTYAASVVTSARLTLRVDE
jgi:hypothetical protein